MDSALKMLMDEGHELVSRRKALEKEQEHLDARFKMLERDEGSFATALGDMGLSSLSFNDGSSLLVKEEYHCSINKNLSDKAVVAEWLEQHGGEDFIEEVMEVDPKYKGLLQENGIKYAGVFNLNTIKVKSWLTEKLGLKPGSMQELELTDLPKGLHFHITQKLTVK